MARRGSGAMVNVGNITSIAASIGSVAVILFALAKWGTRVESKLDELANKAHVHPKRRWGFGPIGALIAMVLMLFKE